MDLNGLLLLLITTVLVPMLTWGVVTLTKLADAKIAQVRDATVRAALESAQAELTAAVYTAVTETQETFVAALKLAGKFTPEDAKIAFTKSFERTKQIMSNSGMEILKTATGALNELITAQIEAALPAVKSDDITLTATCLSP